MDVGLNTPPVRILSALTTRVSMVNALSQRPRVNPHRPYLASRQILVVILVIVVVVCKCISETCEKQSIAWGGRSET